ncbi:sensor domain-containing phosphodiesterase [Novosphingobium terrae]|uniref:sensor domain-containing phosphodiesterase n=1 Tax=Novosphingobium terrae TaxID=2726189 RepID=UPI00197CF411|nr:EAL domain-containing protein [Novosphingobium terrae]
MDLSSASFHTWPEDERLAALMALDILDSPAEQEFDDLTRLAAEVLGVASSAVSLIDRDRQWFKSRHGIPFVETSREVAFCTHTVASRELLVVPDASVDPRFKANPLVAQDGGIRFYAGAPLFVGSGHCLGTLCVFDPAPRVGLSSQQARILSDMARLASERIEARRHRRMGEIAARVVDATSDAVLAANLEGIIVYWNPGAERMFGRSAAEAMGQNFDLIIPHRLAEGHREFFTRAARGGTTRLVGSFIELIAIRADGSEFPVELSLARWGDSGAEQGFAAIVRDVSRRKALERERQHAKAFLDGVITNLPAMLFVKDVSSREYLMVNRAGEQVIGRRASEMVGSTDKALFPEQGADYEQRDSEAIASPDPHVFESAFTRDDGGVRHLRTVRVVIDGPDRPNQYLLGMSEDVTDTRMAEAKVLRLEHYDSMTGLLNRASYIDRLHRLVQDGEPFALLSLDLDRFKDVNDQFGHPAGDLVLAQVGQRLQSAIDHAGWAARAGGDEFVIVLVGGRLRHRARMIADAVIAKLSEPFVTELGVVHAGASVGIVMGPQDGSSTEQLRENVDLALYRAKRMGKPNACFFNADMDASAQDRRAIERDLRRAVTGDEIALAYQPLLSTKSLQITSAEALARWTHPTRGPIRPDIFIPLAEECGLIDRLGENLLRRACTDALSWPKHMRVAVNLSPIQFMSNKLLPTVCEALTASGLAANRLQLEVTEGLVIRDVEGTFKQLEELRSLGIQILIDDFGVGYSSLSYFQRFPFDKVKIDKSFVDEIATSKAAKAIIQAVVGLGEQLDMAIVAEGVETEEQMNMLVALGCTHLQGYLFSKPLSAQALAEMLGAGDAGIKKSTAA